MTPAMVHRVMLLWLLLVAAAVVLSLMPSMSPPGEHGIDKFAHVAAFLGLAAIPATVLPRPVAVLLALAFLAAVGAGIEVAQTFIPGRQGSVADMLANCVGILAGALAGRLLAAFGRRLGFLPAPAEAPAMSTGSGAPGPRAPRT